MEETDIDQTEETRKASPISGCLIFIILFTVFTFLGVFVVWHYLDNKKAIVAISQEESINTRLIQADEAKVTKLREKLEIFSTKVRNKEAAEISITAEDFNLGVASILKMKAFRNRFYISSITKKGIEADVSFEVKGGFSETRYINGTATIIPKVPQGSLFPELTELKPNTGNPVPESYLKFIPQGLFNTYRNDPDIQDVFHKLSTVKLRDGYMLITSDPNVKPAEGTLEDGSRNFWDAVAIFGILFGVIFSTIVFATWFHRAQKKKKALAAADAQN